jgi:hypothetical protein
MMRKIWIIVFALLCGAVAYLSLRAHPAIVTVPLIPHPFAAWLDQHDFLKNLVGFGALAVAGFQAFLPDPKALSVKPRLVTSAALVVFIFLLVAGLELAQTRLPERTCDPRDLMAGGLGIILAWAGSVTFKAVAADVRRL